MSSLEEFRDYARRLSTADHRDDCERAHRWVARALWKAGNLDRRKLSCPDPAPHDPHGWMSVHELGWDCPGLCGGCMPDNERDLWRRLADEVDAYLAPDDDGPDLFGEPA